MYTVSYCTSFPTLIHRLFTSFDFSTFAVVKLPTLFSRTILDLPHFSSITSAVLYSTLPCDYVDIDECAANNGGCSSAANCTNTIGSFTCMCETGYIGNGFNCRGNSSWHFVVLTMWNNLNVLQGSLGNKTKMLRPRPGPIKQQQDYITEKNLLLQHTYVCYQKITLCKKRQSHDDQLRLALFLYLLHEKIQVLSY